MDYYDVINDPVEKAAWRDAKWTALEDTALPLEHRADAGCHLLYDLALGINLSGAWSVPPEQLSDALRRAWTVAYGDGPGHERLAGVHALIGPMTEAYQEIWAIRTPEIHAQIAQRGDDILRRELGDDFGG